MFSEEKAHHDIRRKVGNCLVDRAVLPSISYSQCSFFLENSTPLNLWAENPAVGVWDQVELNWPREKVFSLFLLVFMKYCKWIIRNEFVLGLIYPCLQHRWNFVTASLRDGLSPVPSRMYTYTVAVSWEVKNIYLIQIYQMFYFLVSSLFKFIWGKFWAKEKNWKSWVCVLSLML